MQGHISGPRQIFLQREETIIGGSITTILIIGCGMVVGLIILVFALFITFFPLFKTIRGGLRALRERTGRQEEAVITGHCNAVSQAHPGLTMADGGEHVDEEGLTGDKREA